jgi:hypothetical protein
MLEITEILHQSAHGYTRPYLCRASDDELYYVKGYLAGKESLVFEWIAGCLGRGFNLPIPEFRIVEVPQYLVGSDVGDYSDLGAGWAFGSRYVDALMEITRERARKVPLELQRDVVVFDWWIKNQDRTLGAIHGNPNLFIEPKHGQLVVLDHNCAFDKKFNTKVFVSEHVFSSVIDSSFNDLALRAEYGSRFDAAIGDWDGYCSELPDEWLYVDGDPSGELLVDLKELFEGLSKHVFENFWVTQ